MHVGIFIYSSGHLYTRLTRLLAKKVSVTSFLHEMHLGDYENSIQEESLVPVKFKTVDPRNVAQALALRSYLYDKEIDVVLFKADHWANILTAWFARGASNFLIVESIFMPRGGSYLRGPRNFFFKIDWFIRRLICFKIADEIIATSRLVTSIAMNMYPRKKSRIHYIPIDSAGVVEEIAVERPPEVMIGDHEKVVLLFGRLARYKGVEYLVRAEPIISEVVRDLRIIIAGRGDLTPYMSQIAEREKSFLVLNRSISGGEAEYLYRRADIVVLPYVDMKNASGVLAVAQAHKKPVVVTRVGALTEQVEDGVTGLIVEPKDPYSLAEAIIRLLTDKSLRHKIETNIEARTEVLWNQIADQMLALFEEHYHKEKA